MYPPLVIAAAYEDSNDAGRRRGDPMLKLAMDRLPDGADLSSQPTLSRFKNLLDALALLRIDRAVVDHYCNSFQKSPACIVLDVDDTFDAVHGGQQLRLFNASRRIHSVYRRVLMIYRGRDAQSRSG